jgi:hypothetical protein
MAGFKSASRVADQAGAHASLGHPRLDSPAADDALKYKLLGAVPHNAALRKSFILWLI